MKNIIELNRANKTIDISEALYKKSCVYGTQAYKDLNAMMADFPTFELNIKKSKKETYNGLSFAKMREYLNTQFSGDELKARLDELERVIKVASAKNGKYPLTKKWFLDNYPEYKNAEISENEKKDPASEEVKETELKVVENKKETA